MIENFRDNHENFRDYDSELLLKILNKSSIETTKIDKMYLFADANWKINSKNMDNINSSHNSNLKNIIRNFSRKKILIKNNSNGSQIINLF